MTNKNDGWGCRETSWLAAVILGLVAAIILGVSAGWPWLVSVLGGVAVAVLVGLILIKFFCSETAVEAAPVATPAPVAEPVTAPEPEVAIEPEVVAEPEVEVAEPEPAPAPEPVAVEPAPVKAEPVEVAPVAVPEGEGEKPAAMTAARGGQADDLKVILGIGPKLEELLHGHGIYHYDQIAGWGAKEVAWMDGNIPRFKGRVTRDNWVAQAKEIVEIGVDAYKERAKNNGK